MNRMCVTFLYWGASHRTSIQDIRYPYSPGIFGDVLEAAESQRVAELFGEVLEDGEVVLGVCQYHQALEVTRPLDDLRQINRVPGYLKVTTSSRVKERFFILS